MARYVALLRGINVGGNKKVPMAALRELVFGIGYTEVSTLLQSGNLIFSAKTTPPSKLEPVLQAATREALGVDCAFLVRTAAEWTRLVRANPFPEMAKSDPSHLLVQCCRDTPDAAAIRALRSEISGDEEFKVVGREVFIAYRQGVGVSRLAAAINRNCLETVSSGRNWNTVLKIAAAL